MKKRSMVYQLTTCALMAALMCVLGPMSIQIGPIPVSFTNLVIYLAVYLLGMKGATISYLVYLLLGAVGMPVFSGFAGGPGKLAGPTGGYLIGFIFMALICGFVMEKSHANAVVTILGMIAATLVDYVFGTIWFVLQINEIALIAASKNVSSEAVTQSGDASDKAYLTRTEALDVVYGHAGVTAEEVIRVDVEFDSEHGVMIYEVEFETAGREGEYEIDASTGEILKSELKDRSSAGKDASYVGEAAAREVALAHAGVAAEDVLEIEVELDSDDHGMIYEVQFRTGVREYEYKIDAVTGAVLTCETKDRKNASGESSQPGTSTGDSGSAGESGTSGGDAGESGTSASSSYIGESAAKKAALSHAGVAESSTSYVKCYLEYENGTPACYCVEFKVDKTEYEYEIDLYSGAVLDYDVESHDTPGGETGKSASSESASYIGESAALSAALQHAGVAESSLTKQRVELDRDGSTMVYEVEFETQSVEYEYKIDAVSGEVLKAQQH